jgi:hypothetical protein
VAYLSLHAVFRGRPFSFLGGPELPENGYDLQYIIHVRNNHTLVVYSGNDSKGPFIFTPGTSWT